MIEPIKSSISFGTKSILKTLYESGELDLTYGIYGGRLTRKKNCNGTDTLEHVKPRNKGGKTNLENLAIATSENNRNRSDKPLSKVFNQKNFKRYCDQFKGVRIPYESGTFNGDNYIEGITRTIVRELKNEGRLDLLA